MKNNEILAVAHLLIKDDHPFESPFYLATIETETGIVGCAVRPPPDQLILSDVPIEAIPMLVADVATVYESIPGVSGMENEVEAFAEQWKRQGGGALALKKSWRWYAVERTVASGKPAPGSLRLADSSDCDLVRTWALNFAGETGTSVDVVAFFERRIQTDSLYIWENEGPRSLVAVSGVTPNSVRISGVYTAPEFRRNGYAAVTVAAVSQLMLDAGRQFCVLFAEISDSLVHRLYRRVGYRQVFDTVSMRLNDC